MKNTNKFHTLALMTDDLKLLQEAINLLNKQTKNDNLKDETNRIWSNLNSILNQEEYEYPENISFNN